MKLLGVSFFIATVTICAAAEYEVLLEESDKLVTNKRVSAFGGRCVVRLTKWGNLFVDRSDMDSPFPHPETGTVWATGAFTGPLDYEAALNSDTGALEIKVDGEAPVYKTVRKADSIDDDYYALTRNPYKLVVDEDCRLKVLGVNEFGEETIWSNIRSGLDNTDVLQRGDILTGSHDLCVLNRSGRKKDYCAPVPMHILLQSDCNLVQRVARDPADYSFGTDVVWALNRNQGANEDCYVYVDKNSIGLYRGSFDEAERDVGFPKRKKRYWFMEKKGFEGIWLYGDDGFDVYS